MYATYHFKSTDEITIDVMEAIKTAFKGKSVVLTVGEDTPDDVPKWQQEIVHARLEEISANPAMALTEDEFQLKLQQLRK